MNVAVGRVTGKSRNFLIIPSDAITLGKVTSDDDVFGMKCNFINCGVSHVCSSLVATCTWQ